MSKYIEQVELRKTVRNGRSAMQLVVDDVPQATFEAPPNNTFKLKIDNDRIIYAIKTED